MMERNLQLENLYLQYESELMGIKNEILMELIWIYENVDRLSIDTQLMLIEDYKSSISMKWIQLDKITEYITRELGIDEC